MKAPANDSKTDPMLSIATIAKRLSVSERTVRRWIENGDIPAYKFNAAVRIKERDLTAFIEQRRA